MQPGAIEASPSETELQAQQIPGEAHALAIRSVLAPHGTTLDSFERAYTRLAQMLAEPVAKAGRREEKAAQAADDDEKPVDGDESPPSGFRPPGG